MLLVPTAFFILISVVAFAIGQVLIWWVLRPGQLFNPFSAVVTYVALPVLSVVLCLQLINMAFAMVHMAFQWIVFGLVVLFNIISLVEIVDDWYDSRSAFCDTMD
jgi:hypothetical protein